MHTHTSIPAFKPSLITVGVLYVLMAASILLQGISASMAPFGVPAETLASPHYVDAMTWVYTHMLIIGVLIGLVGAKSREVGFQRTFVRACFAAHLVYLFLDLRTSDTVFGNALYQGGASAIPAITVFCFLCVFGFLSFAPLRETKDYVPT